jgi:hypothetical protein
MATTIKEQIKAEQANERAARIAQRKVDRLFKGYAKLHAELRAAAVWTEDNVEAPGAVSSLMWAIDHSRMVLESLMIEASPEATNSVPNGLF